jgi:hypothetical protein
VESPVGVEPPVILPCAFVGTRSAGFETFIPDCLRARHVVDFSNFDQGCQQLHQSIEKAARDRDFWLPTLLRAAPRDDVLEGSVNRMIVRNNFFSASINPNGDSEGEFAAGADEWTVHDRRSVVRTQYAYCAMTIAKV